MIFIITTLLPSLALSSTLKSVEYAAFNSIYDLCGTGLASKGGSTTTAKYGCGWGLTCSRIKTGPSQICLPNAALASSIGKSCLIATTKVGTSVPCDTGTRCISGLCVGVKTRYNTCGASAYQTAGYPATDCAANYKCHPVPAIGTQAGSVNVNGEQVIFMCLASDDFLPGGLGKKKIIRKPLNKRVVSSPKVCYNGACTALSKYPTP